MFLTSCDVVIHIAEYLHEMDLVTLFPQKEDGYVDITQQYIDYLGFVGYTVMG